jgi:hypothetical protein
MEYLIGAAVALVVVFFFFGRSAQLRTLNNDPFQAELLELFVKLANGEINEHDFVDEMMRVGKAALNSPHSVARDSLTKRIAHMSSMAPYRISDPDLLRRVTELAREHGRTAARLGM